MKKQKALIVASVASMIQQFNMPNIKLLIELGYEVDVACNFIDSGTIPSSKSNELMRELESMKVKYHQVDFDRNAFNIPKNFKAYKQMKKIMLNNYSLVHSHSPIGGVIARITANKYRNKGLKSIYTAHGFHFYKGAPLKMWLLFYPVEKIMSKYTDILITINKEDYNLAKNRLKAVSNIYIPGVGVDTNRFQPIPKQDKVKIRKDKGYSNEDFILIYVGELSLRKNQKMILDVIKTLKNKIQNIKLLLVGTGPLENYYKEYSKELQINENVEFLGYRSDIPELMGMADIAISTSRQEGLPVNVMEAMSLGLPLVLTDCRGNSDLVQDDINGYLSKVDDVDNMAENIYNLYKTPSKIKQIRKNNLNSIKDFSLDKVLRHYKDIY